MKKFYFLFFALLTIQTGINAQSKDYKNGYLHLSIGMGYIDGINKLNNYPIIGIGYEKEICKFLTFNIRLSSYYRRSVDSYYTDDANGSPMMDIIVEGAWGPFITVEDIKKISNTGIKDVGLRTDLTIKEFNMPLIASMVIYTLQFKGHRFGLLIGGGISYNSLNYFKDYDPIYKIKLNDATEYYNVHLSQQTEFRNLGLIDSQVLIYEYRFEDFKIGARFGVCGYHWGWKNSLHWDSSICLNLKL